MTQVISVVQYICRANRTRIAPVHVVSDHVRPAAR